MKHQNSSITARQQLRYILEKFKHKLNFLNRVTRKFQNRFQKPQIRVLFFHKVLILSKERYKEPTTQTYKSLNQICCSIYLFQYSENHLRQSYLLATYFAWQQIVSFLGISSTADALHQLHDNFQNRCIEKHILSASSYKIINHISISRKTFSLTFSQILELSQASAHCQRLMMSVYKGTNMSVPKSGCRSVSTYILVVNDIKVPFTQYKLDKHGNY